MLKKRKLLYNSVLLLLSIIILISIAAVKSKTATEWSHDPWLFLYTIFVTSFQLSRLAGAAYFRSVHNKVHSITSTYEPMVSFVIPCKNEGASIEKTIRKCFEANYPVEKLEVIVINDGSTDNTIEVLRSLQKQYKRLRVVDWKVNKGKRIGMGEGFRMAKGEIIVQLDSDSYIEPNTFRRIIDPFANKEIGAVCAHADPDNADENILTKTQAAYYFLSFRVLKAAESAFLTVFCCSGCSSAYRKNIILPILDEWLDEKFLGKPVTWGDDRSLTNWVIKLGYKTIYTDEVLAKTIVPNNMRQLLKQQTRWKKGWFVNSIFASKFVFKRAPFVSVTYFFPLVAVTLATPIMATRALIYNPIINHIYPFYYVLGVFLVASLITIYYRYISRENKYWPYLFVWSAINMVVLSFILYYALATIQNRKWGTR